MATFPAYVTLLFGATRTDSSIVERSDMERGPAKTRRAASDPTVTVKATLQYTNASDIDLFDAWFYSRDGAQAGAGWFDWTDTRNGSQRQARIVSRGELIATAAGYRVAEQQCVLEYVKRIDL